MPVFSSPVVLKRSASQPMPVLLMPVVFEMSADASSLLDVEQYYQFLDANWEKTQRHIKGKINTEED